MKNFYDLTVIDNFKVLIELDFIKCIDTTNIEINLNDCNIYDGLLDCNASSLNLISLVPINKPFKIEIKLSNIDYDFGHPTIKIKNISVDNKQIMPKYNYTTNYINDNAINTPTELLEFNGVWSLDTVVPFKEWLHEVSGKGVLLRPYF